MAAWLLVLASETCVDVLHEYVSACVNVKSRIDVYDGTQVGSPTLLGSRLVTLTSTCT